MADLRVRFIGDIGNLRTFFSSISGQATQTFASLEALSRRNLASQLGVLERIPARGGIGSIGLGRITAELDTYNDTIRQTAQTVLRTREGLLPIGEATTASASFNEFIQVLQRFETEMLKARNAAAAAKGELAQIKNEVGLRNDYLKSPVTAQLSKISALRSELDTINGAINSQRDKLTRPELRGAARQSVEDSLNKKLIERARIIGQIGAEQRVLNGLQSQYAASVSKDTQLQGLRTRQLAAEQQLAAAGAQAVAAGAARRAGLESAYAAGPPVPQNILTTLKSTELTRILQQAGLGYSADAKRVLSPTEAGFGRALNQQGARFNEPVRDLVRNVTRVGGTFKDATGQIVDFSAELDQNGRVVTRFGGQLSGIGQTLNQVSRNFQKVIQWTIATTAVFGGLQYVIGQLQSLRDLDALLQRFAVTAQLSPTAAGKAFDELAEIAERTATPIKEILGAADDIALATRRSGQSTEAWHQDILNLTESVGVFTNLTGVDTVKATDLLTASMKQLGLTTAEIPGLLSKITAVAGGQANAIADITQGLAVMAEAGKQGGLSVDQQIATVQILSQVTAKSPAEVATAFKNLVGSLGSPAALKAFEKFGINARNVATGTVRNILDIYGEIADKVRTGIIPAGDLQGLVRAISGGPRRAPDAAALLSAIDQIALAEERAARATNEAAIANAKALDTTQARLVQLQTKLDVVTFKKFGDDLKNLTGALLSFADALLTTFNSIPTGLITSIVQVGVFALAIRGGIKILTLFGTFLQSTRQGLIQLATAFKTTSIAESQYMANGYYLGPTGPVPPSRFGGLTRGTLGSLGAGAFIGAGITAASGGNLNQTIGGGLQGLGLAALAAPVPLPWLKVGGAIATVVGTVLQFISSSEEAADSSIESATKIIEAYNNLEDASKTIGNLKNNQDKLAKSISDLEQLPNKTSEDLTLLADSQRTYVLNMLEMASATREVESAIRELQASGAFAGFGQAFNAARRGELNAKDFESVVREMQLRIIRVRNPELQLPETYGLLSPEQIGRNFAPLKGVGTVTQQLPDTYYVNQQGPSNPIRLPGGTKSTGLKEFLQDANNVTKLFSGGKFVTDIQLTSESIDLINGALAKLAETSPETAQGLQKIFNTAAAGVDSSIALSTQLELLQVRIEALTFLDPQKAAELSRLASLVTELALLANQADAGRSSGPPDERGNKTVQRIYADLAESLYKAAQSGTTIDRNFLEPLLQQAYDALNPKDRANFSFIEFASDVLVKFGYDLEQMGFSAREGFGAVSEAAKAAAEDVLEVTASIFSEYAQKSAALEQSLLDEQITPEQYATQRAAIDLVLGSVNGLGEAFANALESNRDFEEALNEFAETLTKIPGLEDATTLGAGQLIERLFALGEAGNFTSAQLKEMLATLLNVINGLEVINKIRARFSITAVFTNLEQFLAYLKGLYRLSELERSRKYGEPVGGDSSILQAIAEIEAAIKQQNTIGDTLKPNPTPVKPSSGGGGGPDVSTIDLPEEIANAINRDALIAQAINNAKKLQSQIPGATKEASDDIVELLKGTQRILEVRGVKDDLLRRALEELAEIEKKRLEFETKADTIRRIRVGSGSFAALANVPLNSQTGVSVGSPQGPISININLNGQLLTPAQFEQLANQIGAVIKNELANG